MRWLSSMICFMFFVVYIYVNERDPVAGNQWENILHSGTYKYWTFLTDFFYLLEVYGIRFSPEKGNNLFTGMIGHPFNSIIVTFIKTRAWRTRS